MQLSRLAFALLIGMLVPGALSPAASAQGDAPTASYAEPAISPDHREIAFVCGGDIWSVPAEGGDAHLLVATEGTASRPIFSPDGSRIAFVSTRPGAVGIDVVTLAGGTLTRLTHDDVVPELDGWSHDGRFVYFSTSAHNIGYAQDIMRVAVAGGTPMRVIGERFVNAMQGVPAPDGTRVAYIRNGFVQWWRRGHSHIDQSELVVAQLGTGHVRTITAGESKDRWPMWADGGSLYFVSDRTGSDELWLARDGKTRVLTQLRDRPVLWPTISADAKTIAFEHAASIWTYDTSSGTTRRVPITLRGGAGAVTLAHVVATNRFSALDLAPDGKKLAFIARGRVFAAGSGDDNTSQLVTPRDTAAYDLPVWSADSRRVAYVVDRGAEQAIAVAELPDGAEQILTPAGHHDDYPHWSPDGSHIAFVRDGRELHVVDVATQRDRVVARGILDRRPFGDLGDIAYSPAGDWIAYVDSQAGFANVRAVPSGGGESRPITFFPNGNTGPLAWSPDGTRLYVVTSQRTEDGAVAQIDLVPRAPRFAEDAFRALFDRGPARDELPSRTVATPLPSAMPAPNRSAAPNAAHATKIDFDGIRERVTFLSTGLDVSAIRTVPDGKSIVLVAGAVAEENLFVFPVDETSDAPAIARQITSTAGSKTDVSVAPDGKSVYFLDAGSIFNAPLDGSKSKRLAVTAEFDVDFAHEKRLVFAQAWSLLDRWYADPHFHGADWDAVERTYAPLALGARTPDELRRVISLMLGELNSSHLGINGPRNPAFPRWSTGRLGVQWEPQANAGSGRLRIGEIVPLGPVALAGGVAVGDDVVAVDTTPVDASVDIDALLANHIGKRTVLRIAPHGDLGAARSVVVLPIDTPTEQTLLYKAWVASRRAYVERHSGGRLGYVHLYDMSADSLDQFALDLDTQNRTKAGVIVDIRNNEGGFVDPYAIDILTRREYVRFVSRFGTDPPERTALGQRTLDKPSVLVINEHSLSDAENFTEAYRALHAGPVVGVPSAGWIIFTSSARLADGSALRLPSTRVYDRNGVELEQHPRPVDVYVDNPPEAAARGDDPQLDAAIRSLLHIAAR